MIVSTGAALAPRYENICPSSMLLAVIATCCRRPDAASGPTVADSASKGSGKLLLMSCFDLRNMLSSYP